MRSWRSVFPMVAIAIVAGLAWSAAVTAQTEYKLTASDTAQSDLFGYSVSISGEYAIVGAYQDDDDGNESGSAYIFRRDGTAWAQQAKLTASDAAQSDYFGYSVSVSGDHAVVGAYGNDDNGSKSGSAYIFKRDGTSWSQQAKLTASDAAPSDQLGSSVSISGDYAVVGASRDDGGHSFTGSAYIFKRDGTSWSQQIKLTSSDAAQSDHFGFSVSIDGNYAIVGAQGDDDGGSYSGSAYIFFRSGTTWSQQAKLTASDAAQSDLFGRSVSVSDDYAIVGAYGDDDGGGRSGSAYIFKRDGTTWSQQAKLTAYDAARFDDFGHSVSINGDYAIMGARGNDAHRGNDDGSNSGSAYIFSRSGATWTQQAKLTASYGSSSYLFYLSVSISGDYAVVGATGNDAGNNGIGSAYVYTDFPSDPLIEVSPAELDFGPVSPGSFSLDSLKVKNVGAADLSVSAVAVTGVDTASFVATPLSLSVPAGDSAWVKVTFTPTSVGAKTATLQLTHNSAGSPTAIPLTGTSGGRYLVAWGSNENGQTDVPEGLTDAIAIAGGEHHSLAVKSDGTVVAWGNNDNDQTDVPEGLTDVTAIAAGSAHSLALKSDGTVIAWGLNNYGQASVPGGLTNATAIATGYRYSLALKSDGTVVAWGYSGQGQTDLPDGLTDVTGIAAGANHSLAVKSDGTVVAWGGQGNYGETDVPEGLTNVIAVAGGWHHSLALKSDGTVVAWGNDNFGQATVPGGLVDITAIAGSGNHNLALKSGGTVIAWGWNNHGQAIVPGGLTNIAAIAAGYSHTLVLAENTEPRIATTSRLTFGDVALLDSTAADTVSIKIKNTGSAPLTVEPQDNMDGGFTVSPAQLTVAPADSVRLSVQLTATAPGRKEASLVLSHNDTSVGSQTTISVHVNVFVPGRGTVVAWGNNLYDQTDVPEGLTDVTAIAAGGEHSLALQVDGTVVAWGRNNHGQSIVPDSLTNVRAIAAGWGHSLALKSDGTVIGWGTNYYGFPEDLTDVIAIGAGYYYSLALKADGTVVASGSNSSGQTNVPDNLTEVTAIAAGSSHSLALQVDGTVVAWGSNEQTNVPEDLTGVTAIAAGSVHSLALKSDGTVVAWGRKDQRDVPEDLIDVTAITARDAHSLALKSDGTVVGWGAYGGRRTNLPADLTGVIAIAERGDHALALISEASIATSPVAVSFGVVALGSSAADSLKVKNTGTGFLSVTGIAVTGTDTLSFAATPAALSVAGGDSTFVKVTFTPSSLGAQTASLQLTHNASGSPPTIPLTGTGGRSVTNIADTLSFSSDDGSNTKVKFESGTITGVSVGHQNHGRHRPASTDSSSAPTIPLTYFEINTTLADTVTFEAMVSFQYTQTLLDSAGITDETTLKLFRYDAGDGIWVQLVTSVDTSTKTVSATTNSFSVWSLASVTPTGIYSDNMSDVVPHAFSLAVARPNPFNPSTTIAYEVPEQTHVTLTIYNLLGQEVVRLMDQVQAAGRYEVVWHGVNSRSAGVSSGVYLYRIVSGSGYTDTKRMTLLK